MRRIQAIIEKSKLFFIELRIVQPRGKKILKVDRAFPRNCNDRTQYFKVEILGHILCDASINGDVICHNSLKCNENNGDVRSEGDINVHVINSQKINCKKYR